VGRESYWLRKLTDVSKCKSGLELGRDVSMLSRRSKDNLIKVGVIVSGRHSKLKFVTERLLGVRYNPEPEAILFISL
jgi:hypothetical protein